MSKHVDSNPIQEPQTGEEFPVEAAAPEYGAGFDSDRLRDEAREVMVRQSLKASVVAEQIGYSKTVLSRWLNGKDKQQSTDAIDNKIREWLAKQPRSSAGSFVETPTAERILSTLAYAQVHGDMVHIYGGPGIGKTSSLNQFVETYPDKSWLTTMTPSSATLVPALKSVGIALGLGALQGGAQDVSWAIRKHLKREDTDLLLVIDEAQHLSMPAIEELRSIHDETNCGIALVGNETSHARLQGGARAANFAQIYSRLGAVLCLPRPTDGDVNAICDSWPVKDEPARGVLRDVAKRPGGLRSVVKVLRLISRSGQSVNRSRVIEACRMLGAQI